MKQEFRRLYKEMLQDIHRCMQLELSERERVDGCFWIARNYWDKLKAILKMRGFKDENDEIDFFRNVKPRFTCYIEYYVILTEALVCVPISKDAAVSYWKEEVNRVKRFCDKHSDFIIYYQCKRRHSDAIYFLRKNNRATVVTLPAVYDADPEYGTSHDSIIRTFLAYDMYAKYVRKRLWELTHSYRGIKVKDEN